MFPDHARVTRARTASSGAAESARRGDRAAAVAQEEHVAGRRNAPRRAAAAAAAARAAGSNRVGSSRAGEARGRMAEARRAAGKERRGQAEQDGGGAPAGKTPGGRVLASPNAPPDTQFSEHRIEGPATPTPRNFGSVKSLAVENEENASPDKRSAAAAEMRRQSHSSGLRRSSRRRTPAFSGETPKTGVLSGTRKAPAKRKKDSGKSTPGDSCQPDTYLYDFMLQANSPLDQVVTDWLEMYSGDQIGPLLQLVNFLVHCSGLREVITRDHFENEEVVDVLSMMQEHFDQDLHQDYPLISKSKQYKRFRYNVVDFMNKLIKGARVACLSDGVFIDTFQTWVIAMSSSPFRPFRHTAAVIGLAVTTALCELGQAVAKALAVAERQLGTEKKNATPGGLRNKERALENKVRDLQQEKGRLIGFIKGLFEGIFILRYRDVDPAIRSDCITELASWMTIFPEYFLSDQLMKYIGWLLSDKVAHVRIAALKATTQLVEKPAQSTASSVLRRFFQRFHGRIVDMTLRESDLHVRAAALALCAIAGQHGHLLESDAEDLCPLVFHSNFEVRRGVAPFFASVLEGEVTEAVSAVEARVGDDVDIDEDKVKLKVVVTLLARYGNRVKAQALLKEDESMDEEEDSEAMDKGSGILEDPDDAGVPFGGRIGKAVEAIWSATPILHRWALLLNYACEDQSAQAANDGSQPMSGAAARTNRILDGLYKLTELEDAALVQVMVASVYYLTTPEAVPGLRVKDKKKAQEAAEKIKGDVSRALIDALPKLITKYSASSERLRDVLSLILLMDLGVYAELRMPRAFESVVSDVIHVFRRHGNRLVMDSAAHCLAALSRANEYGELARDRLNELVEDLVAKIAEYNDGNNHLAVTDFDDDEHDELYATLAKLERFSAVLNPLSGFDDSQNGTAATSVLERIAERGKLGQAEDGPLVLVAVRSLYQLLLWRSFALRLGTEMGQQADAGNIDLFVEFRRRVIALAEKLSFGPTRAAEAVKNSAFNILVDVCLLSSAGWVNELGEAAGRKVQLVIPDGKQERYATHVSTTIEQYASDVALQKEEREDNDGSRPRRAVSSQNKRKRTRKGGGKQAAVKRSSEKIATASHGAQPLLRRLHNLKTASAGIVKLIRHGVIHAKHASLILAWYGRLDAAFDEICKKLADVVGDVWSSQVAGGEVRDEVANTCLESLKESFERHTAESVDYTAALAKLLAQALRFQKSAVHETAVVQFHEAGAEHALAKAAGYRRINAHSAVTRALKFFRALVPFAGLLPRNDAARVADKVEKIAEANGLRPEGRDWDPYQTYLRQLRASKVAPATPVSRPPARHGGQPAGQGHGEEQRTEPAYPAAEEVDDRPLTRRTKPRAERTEERAEARSGNDVTPRRELGLPRPAADSDLDGPSTTHASDAGDSGDDEAGMSDADGEAESFGEPGEAEGEAGGEQEPGSSRKWSGDDSDSVRSPGQGDGRPAEDDEDGDPADSLPDRRKRMRR